MQDLESIKHINQVVPPFLQKNHNELMENVITRGRSVMIKTKLSNFIYDREKFIIPAYVFLDHSFLYQNDFCINATLLKINDGLSYIIFDRYGSILGISRNLYKKLFI